MEGGTVEETGWKIESITGNVRMEGESIGEDNEIKE